jgi:hydrophobe/amphiphile efflux-1 (HAE1) family protein
VTAGTGLPGLSVRRPWLAVVMNLMIVIAGVAALFGVEVRELPNTDRPVVSVRGDYPGASPTTVDAELTRVVEGAVARVNGVVSVRSASEESNFRMRIEFRPDVSLIDAANDVREAVARVTRALPEGVENLFVVKSDADASPVLRLALSSAAYPVDRLTRIAEDDISPELTSIEGVADVTLSGARERVVRVDVSPERLAAYGLSIAEVAAVLRDAQFDVPVGSFSGGAVEILVRADATVTEPVAIEQLMVRDRVRLRDVASVYFAPAEPSSIVRLDGMQVVSLGVVRQAGANTVAISDGVARAVRRLEARFPEIRLAIVSDDAVFIRGAIAEVLTSLALALVIVAGVIWLFLGRIGATLVPIVAMPVALIGAVAGIWALGFSINLVTLLALVLATGIVVDDAIVVLENIQRKRAEGLGPRAAAVIGTREVIFAVLATTVTLIAVFVPISLLPSEAGRIFREFGFVLAITVGLSSFVALTLAPMISARLSGLGERGPALGEAAGWLLGRAYALVLRPVVALPLVTLTAAGLVAGAAALAYEDLGTELVPSEDRGRVVVWLQGPDGIGLDAIDKPVAEVEEMFGPWIERGAVTGLYSITGRWDINRGWIQAGLVPWEQRTVTQQEIEADIAARLDGLPGAQGRVSGGNSLGLRGGSGGGLEIAITGPDYPGIAAVADDFVVAMEGIEGLDGVRMQYQATQPQLSLAIDRQAAADLDVPVSTLSATLRALVDRDKVAELTIADTAAPIMLRSEAGTVRDPTDLMNLYVRAESGRLVALSQLVTLSETGVAAELDRYAQRRAIEIGARLTPGLPLAGAVTAVQALAAERLPDGYGLVLLGEAATLDETTNAVAITFLIALLVVFLVLVANFESVTSALVVLVTVPFGIAAAVLSLWLTGTTINIYSQIGVLMLIGIMAKNGILMVEVADQWRDRGLAPAAAALRAASQRLRPIAMTLASTILAGLPLILSSGPGAEGRAAIGWVIVGGLGLAAAFTLLLTPAAYALIAPLAKPRAHAAARLETELAAAETPRTSPAE